MGFFQKPKKQTVSQSQDTTQMTDEAKETAAKKQRLLETEGGNLGSELNTKQTKSVRRIFGG